MSAGRAYRPHRAGRPHWRCTACGAPYPCSPARLSLLIEYAGNRVALAIYLAAMLQDALGDAYRLGLRPDPRAMHRRFLGWLTRPRDVPSNTVEAESTPGQGRGGRLA